ncbi:unnamed protein product [Candidula unifasciata]|uniref:TGF-beta family profile domain-containing protein n=1 Tax=Candidula unifasciata TaxID=100452 RepID=A0A8S4A7L6_9EUPU|nr:unnamed protein product [Candidula unifasciata]
MARDAVSYNFSQTVGENLSNQSVNLDIDDKINQHSFSRRGNYTLGKAVGVSQELEKFGNSSQSDSHRILESTTTNQNTRHAESVSENDTKGESPPRNSDHSQQMQASRVKPADGTKTVGRVKSTIKDWFLELTKRINRPSWLMSQPDTSFGASRNHTHYLSSHSEPAFNSTNTSFFDYNTMANDGSNLTHQLPDIGQSGSVVENYQDESTLRASDLRQGRKHPEYNNVDNSTKDNVGKLFYTDTLNHKTLDSRNDMSEDTELPVVNNLTTQGNVLEDEYVNSTLNDDRKSTEDLHLGNDSSECPSCRQHTPTEELIKTMRLNMFKNLLVQKLRWDPASLSDNSGGRLEENIPIIPDSLVEETLRDNAREYERDEFHARDQEIIIAGEDMGRDCIKLHVTGCYSFHLKGRIRGEVAEAQLWLYKMEDANDMIGQTVTVYELERLKSGRLYHSSMIASLDTMTKQGWVELNVTRSLVKWVDKRKGTKLIAIRCVTCATRGHRALYGAKHGYKPLLVIKYMKDGHLLRSKRSISCDPRYECCKLELLVNFQDIGMPHILQPRQLSVGYCFGECNENHSYTSNHTIIRQRVRWSQPSANQHSMNQQLKPCCVPAILKDIFIMTSDGDGSIVRKLLPKVVVETCGCM